MLVPTTHSFRHWPVAVHRFMSQLKYAVGIRTSEMPNHTAKKNVIKANNIHKNYVRHLLDKHNIGLWLLCSKQVNRYKISPFRLVESTEVSCHEQPERDNHIVCSFLEQRAKHLSAGVTHGTGLDKLSVWFDTYSLKYYVTAKHPIARSAHHSNGYSAQVR
jgi:hypothetical protein